MELNIEIKRPAWDPHPEKSETNNHEWRQCVVVSFPNCSFQWIPTYRDIADILLKLRECELINKRRCIANGN